MVRLDSLEDRLAPSNGVVSFANSPGGESGTEGALNNTVTVSLVTNDAVINTYFRGHIDVTTGLGTDLNAFNSTPDGPNYYNFSFTSADPYTLVNGNRIYTKTVPVNIIDDQIVQPVRMDTLTLSNIYTGSTDAGNLAGSGTTLNYTIHDNDKAVVTFAGAANVTEGGSPSDTQNVTATLTLVTSGSGSPSLAVPVSATLQNTNDYTAAPVTWPAGSPPFATQTITVTPANDNDVEGTETFTATPVVTTTAELKQIVGGASVTITDTDSAVISPTTSAVTVTEGGATANVTVKLAITASGSGPATLAYPVNVTLQAQPRYTATTYMFPAGAPDGATGTIVVTAVDDNTVQGTELFAAQPLILTPNPPVNPYGNPMPVTVSGTVDVTVQDNDSATISLNPSGTVTVNEGGASVNVPVKLTINSTGTGPKTLAYPVSVTLPATAQYTVTPYTFGTTAANSADGATGNIVITAVDDQIVQAALTAYTNQALQIVLPANNPQGNPIPVTATGAEEVDVKDNDTAVVTFSGAANVTEGGSPLDTQNVTATLTLNTPGSGTPSLAVPVSATIVPPPGVTDFTASTVTWNSGSPPFAPQTITVTPVNDNDVEGTEDWPATGVVTTTALNSIAGGATVTINDSDSANISASTSAVTVTEGGATANVTVTLAITATGTGLATLAYPVKVSLQGGPRYTASTYMFPAGAPDGATGTIVVTAVDDNTVQGTELFATQNLILIPNPPVNPFNHPMPVTVSGTVDVTVKDNDTAAFSLNPAGTVTVNEAGATSANVPVKLTITGSGTGSKTLAYDVSVTLPGNPRYSATPYKFPAGSADGATGNIVVTALDDNIVQGDESFANQALQIVLPANNPSGNPIPTSATGSETVVVTDNDSGTIKLNPAGTVTVTEGGGTMNVPVVLSLSTTGTGSQYLAYPVAVTLPGNTRYTATPYTFPAGSHDGDTGNIVVKAVDDQIVQGNESFANQALQIVLPANNPSGNPIPVTATGSETVVVNDNDTATIGITAGSTLIVEGGAPANVPVTLTLNTSGTGPASLGYPVSVTLPGNARYTATPYQFPAGSHDGDTGNIVVKAFDDQIVQPFVVTFPSEALQIVLPANNPSGNPIPVTATGTRTIQVQDNDKALVTYTTAGGNPINLTEGITTPQTVYATLTLVTSGSGPISLATPVSATLTSPTNRFTSSTVTWGDGTPPFSTQNIGVTVIDDQIVQAGLDHLAANLQPTSLATVNAAGTVPVDVTDNDSATVNITSPGTTTLTEGGASANVGVTLSLNTSGTGAVSLGVPVTVTLPGNSQYTATPYTFPAGSVNGATGNIVVSAPDDNIVEVPTQSFAGQALQITTTANVSPAPSTTQTINVTETDSAKFTINNATVNDNGGSAVFTVTLDHKIDIPVSVKVSFGGGNAVAGTDYTATPQTLTFAANTTGSQTVSVPVFDHETKHLPLTFTASLSTTTALNGRAVDLSSTGTGTINDPDYGPPSVGNQSLTVAEETPLNGTLTGTDPDNYPLTFSIVNGPTHGTISNFNPSTGTFTYTGGTEFWGSDSFTYKASDGTLFSNTGMVSLTVTQVDDAPVASNASFTTNEETQLVGALAATDADGPFPLNFIKVSDPAHGTVSVLSNGTFTYTPAANFFGSDSFTFKANDGTLDSNVATILLTVNRVDDPPVANNGSLTTNEETAVNGTLTSSDVDGPAPTYIIVTNPAHGTLTNFNASTGTFTYTPGTEFWGSDSFTFKANDGTLDSNIATIIITVVQVDDPPVASNTSFTTNEETQLVGALSATDADGPFPLNFIKVTDPAHGTVTVLSNGTFTYTPVANFFGSDSFTFKANDGTLDSNVATVSITVNRVDDAPVANDGTLTTNEETAVNGTLTSSDVDGPAATYIIVSNPVHGTISNFNATAGTFTYTPVTDYNGPDSFTFKANDGTLDSNIATINITVVAVNDAPVLTDNAVIDAILQATANPPGRKISSLFNGIVSDADIGDSVSGIAVIGNPQNANQGTWQYSTDNGTTWFAVGTVADGATALALSAATKLRFLPEPWFFGDPDPLTVRAMDSTYAGGFTAGATHVNVNSSVNGDPTAISGNTALVQNPVFQSDVPGAWLSASGYLFVAGTSGNDKITINPKTVKINNVLTPQIVVTLNGTVIGTFNSSAVTGRIVARGLGGNDSITVGSTITQGADLYGGSGNDTLTGGAGNDRLFGEDGNDRLNGGKGHNLLVGGAGDDRLTNGGASSVLIGGGGADTLTAGKSGDLLIAGSTDFENDLTDLSKLMDVFNEWTSASDYNTRITHLTGGAGGLNGTTFLNNTTVHDDGVKDVLTGGKGLDWFVVSALDKFTLKPGEQSLTI
jgi:hypothetical protein